ncbi:MAG: RNA polymerase sigma factor [Gammaproteobacteria bacterium]
MGEYSLLDLMHRVAEQDERALTDLYDATVARVFALALRVAGNQADAEEVVCDVYSQVWDRAMAYDDHRGSVMAWLMMMCRSRALDLLRRNASRNKAHRRAAENAATQPLAHWDPVEDVQANTRLYTALEALPTERRQVVGLAYFRGLSHEEISVATSIPLGTVKSHVRRGLNTLRQHFEGLN